MATICIRLLIVYFATIICMRIMGKRQIGELEISELVTAIFISELATSPITDTNIPLLHGIIPTLILLCLEIIMSFLAIKSNFFKNLLGKNPTFLIEKGIIDEKGLEKVRITINELMTELRLKDVADPTQVNYAILEPNGKISISLKAEYQNATPNDMGISVEEKGIHHLVVSDGAINYSALKACGKSKEWLKSRLSDRKLQAKEIFIMTVDDADNIFIMKKVEK